MFFLSVSLSISVSIFLSLTLCYSRDRDHSGVEICIDRQVLFIFPRRVARDGNAATGRRTRTEQKERLEGCGVRSRKARQKRPAQNSERNVILNDNKAKVIIV